MSVTTSGDVVARRWLRSPRFDLVFILGIFWLALVTGAIVLAAPELFMPVLILDLWFLGYHHVIATYTRLCFDAESFRQRGFLVYGFLPAVAILTLLVAWQIGLWVIVSIYFYWQWWHYTRQSWGISRAADLGPTYTDPRPVRVTPSHVFWR
jgi:hypothetical protein